MSESARMWVEISFNIVYLIAVWGIVIAMTLQKDRVAPENRRVADRRYAFALLALGDTGHVGFRVRRMLRTGSKARSPSSAGKLDWSGWVRWLRRSP